MCQINVSEMTMASVRVPGQMRSRGWLSQSISPVILIISLYLSYKVHFVIIIVEFFITVLSITYLRNFSESGLSS